MEWLLEYEREWFLALNGSHGEWLDGLMLAFAGAWAWFPLLLFPLYDVIRRRRGWVAALLGTLPAVAVSMMVTEGVVKPAFKRFRPTHHPLFMNEVTIVNDYIATGDYGFISGNSTSAFAFAVMSALAIKNRRYSVAIFLWALTMAYSSVYLGAHFITDVVPGMITGAFIGWLAYLPYKFMQQKES